MAKGRQQYFADEVSIQKEAREFAIEEELKAKIDSVEEGAQVNVIETVKVNGDPLVPDENKAVDVDVPLVEDNLYSVDTEAALSARQGKVLYEYIQNLQSRGRFLSNWNCATGLPTTNPYDSPYEYRAGDYYLVSNVSSGTNYRPEGTEYITGQASLTVESEEVKVSDMYIYDGTDWLLILNTERPIAIDDALSPTSVNPVENRVVTQAFGTKQDIIQDLATIRAGAALGDTSVQPGDSLSVLSGDSDDIVEGSSHLFMTTQERAKLGNQSGINTGDETKATIEAKLQAASASNNGYLSSTDWSTFNNKENAIADLQDIRSNAQAGKNASDTIATYGNIVTHNMNEFATAAQGALAEQALQSGDNVSDLVNDAGYITAAYHDDTKQDALVAGDNITIGDVCIDISDMQGPCPEGYHVPLSTEWQAIIDAFTTFSMGGATEFSTYLKLPDDPQWDGPNRRWTMSGRYLCSNMRDWTSPYCLNCGTPWNELGVRTTQGGSGLHVRAFKNEAVIPDASWTVIYDGSSVAPGAGFFYNVAEGLISVSVDGTNRYTLMDKNLGATIVRNFGDTYSEDNCGGLFQWGNIHMFAYGEPTNTTTTEVSASGYGPGHYYNSDEFYRGSHRRSNTNVGNLRGGVSQGRIQRCDLTISATDTTYVAGDFDIKDLADSTGLRTTWSGKQDALDLGANLSWGQDGKLNATDTTYTAGPGISISNNNVISNTQTSAEWGNITGTLSDQTDLQDALDDKQDELTAGDNITIGEVCESNMRGPAPSGFHVPLSSEWVALCGVLTNTFSLNGNATTAGTYLKMPMAGGRDTRTSNIKRVNDTGCYWSSTAYQNGFIYYWSITSSGWTPANNYISCEGYSVRCIKDIPVEPTSSWVMLYDGSNVAAGAGIFRNSIDGLISISGDGVTWYTIQDKNLGATTVYNQGDTLTDANCGYFYQRGNNYGFPHSGNVTTSSTKVDASTYGPGNYYNSSTFITVSASPYDWSSVENKNLWGGVSQGQSCALVISAQVPDSAEWGNITGTLSDQTDLQTALNAKADTTDVNTKTFYLSSTSDLTNAQAAYDWYLAGKTPIIGWNGATFILSRYDAPNVSGALLKFREGYRKITGVWDNKYTAIGDGYVIRFWGSNNTVSQIDIGESMNYSYGYLSPGINYSNPYTPEYAGSPATKKYVDDAVAGITPGQTYTAGNGIDITNNEISVDTSIVATQTDVSGMVSKGTNDADTELFRITSQNLSPQSTTAFGPDFVRCGFNNGTSLSGMDPTKTGVVDYSNNKTSELMANRLALVDFNNMTQTTYAEDGITVADNQYGTSEAFEFAGGGNNQIARLKDVPVISATQPTGTEGMIWYDTTNDVLKVYNGTDWKEAGTQMKVLSYGSSTWQDFLNAYNENAIVYCKASSNSNPGSGVQGRMAFMAYVSINSSTGLPTEVEFQYYRSRSDHNTAANQLDQVFVYKLTSASGGTWTVTERNTGAKAVAGTGISLGWGSGNMTISNTGVTSFNGDTGAITLTPGTYISLNNNVIDVDTSLIATKADLANFAGFLVVAQLPSTDIKTNIIYLLGPVGTGADKYEEYIYSNNNWIMIGDTTIDLSPYFHKTNDDSDDIIEGSTNLFLTSTERTILGNTSGTNSGDETKTTIQTKLGAASTSNSGYLTSTDWDTFNGKANATDVNTKTFYLSSTSDLTNAQAVYDWYVAGKNPIIVYNNRVYMLYGTEQSNARLTFVSPTYIEDGDGEISVRKFLIMTVNGTVDELAEWNEDSHNFDDYLKKNNGTAFTPTGNYNPATKKYVDDAVDVKIFHLSGTTGATALAEMQEAYDWVMDGKDALLYYDRDIYVPRDWSSSEIRWYDTKVKNDGLALYQQLIQVSVSSGDVTGITLRTTQESRIANVLTITNTTSYTPSADYHPATKKYVDDSVSVVSGDSGVEYTIKVSNSAPASGTASNIITIVTN